MTYKIVCSICGKTFETQTPRIKCDECRPLKRPKAKKTRPHDPLEDAKRSIGEKFGLLTVLDVDRRLVHKNTATLALCRCECGTEKWIRLCHIKKGKTLSCGCLLKNAHSALGKSRTQCARQRKEHIVRMLNDNPEMTYAQIAQDVGVTREHIRATAVAVFGKGVTAARKRRIQELSREERDELERLRAMVSTLGAAHKEELG